MIQWSVYQYPAPPAPNKIPYKIPHIARLLPGCCPEKQGNGPAIPNNWGNWATICPRDRTKYPISCYLTGQLVQCLPIEHSSGITPVSKISRGNCCTTVPFSPEVRPQTHSISWRRLKQTIQRKGWELTEVFVNKKQVSFRWLRQMVPSDECQNGFWLLYTIVELLAHNFFDFVRKTSL
jgi:hypothetical protein